MPSQEPLLPDTARCKAFWAREETDRPLLTAWVGSYEVPTLYQKGLSQTPEGEITPADIDCEAFREDYEKLFENHRELDIDVPWAGFPLLVVPWVESITGCPLYHKGGNFRAEHWLDTYERLDELTINQDWLDKLVGFTRWLVELSGGRFPVALCLMRGPADLLAALRGAERSVYDLIDHPEQVGRALQTLTDIWIQVAHAQLEHIPTFAGGYCFGVQNLWSPTPGGWFQDDAIAYWSPRYYRRHVISSETRLAHSMEATGIHLHPASLFTVDDLIEIPDLDVIEINLDDVGPRIPDMIPRFRQILENKPLFVWGAFTREDLVVMKENLPIGGLALQLMGETPEEVQAMIEEANSIWSS